MIEVNIDDHQVTASLNRLLALGVNAQPVFQDIGEYLVESTKQRFVTSTAPDGTPWAPNSEATMLRMLHSRGGLSKQTTATGGHTLTKKGASLLAAKKPLIGESRRLGTEIFYRATVGSVEVGSPLEYAGTQQFGADRGKYGRTKQGRPIPWGDIPDRPFLGLSDADKAMILDILQEHLEIAVKG